MPQDNVSIREYQFDADDDYGPGADTVSFPASVQRKIDNAALALRDGDARGGLSLMHEVGVELARTDPLLFAGLMAAHMGVTGVAVTRSGRTVRTVQTERHALGVRIGRDVQTTTDEFFEQRSVSFGGQSGGRR